MSVKSITVSGGPIKVTETAEAFRVSHSGSKISVEPKKMSKGIDTETPESFSFRQNVSSG